ncbi:MAG: ABC transporter permease [Oscillospiraceae bacterium]|jgi:ABC-type dipeptide/oligopeptide/nickel transport system permease component
MAKYIGKRLLRSLLTLFIIITIVFSLLRLMPIEGYFENFEKLSSAQINVGLRQLGLKDPVPVQMMNFWKGVMKGDWGVSHKYRVGTPVLDIIAEKIPVSLKMGLAALGIALLLGLPLGILMAHSTRTRFKIGDKLGTVFVVIIEGIPAAIYHLLIQFYGSKLPGGFDMFFRAERPVTWILPIFSLALGNIAYYAMWLRRYMVDENNKDYVKLARAKGVSGGKIFRSHVFRNAIVPLAQFIPTSVILTLMGSLYVESLYSIPGMGGLLVQAIQRQDNTLVQALVLIYAAISILGLLVGDLFMALLDPRIALGKKEGDR